MLNTSSSAKTPTMKSEVTLLLICMLFSKGEALTCQQCLPPLTGSCKQESCPDQCLTSTTSVYFSGTKVQDVSLKTCGTVDVCADLTGSMNLATMKVVNNAKCCNTDLCNTDTLPALPIQAPNGRTCYVCDSNGCSGTVQCEGSEDRCITATVQQGGNTISMKGCVSRSFCAASGSTNTGISISNVKCCEGNLCNGAESLTLGFLLMLLPLLSSTIFF